MITFTMNYEVEVDEDNPIVQEYETLKDLVEDLVAYRFSTLPVIGNGVDILDKNVLDVTYSSDY